MPQRFLCVHAHFYQPPRESPWSGEVEQQDSAAPYHDWNERITDECYRPNARAKILRPDGTADATYNLYENISFNFGPTLLKWMERHAPDVYASILAADKISAAAHGGHGNALAQNYNHLIMPLANFQDKRTQVIWGIKDFEHRFNRRPEGMWLAETAADTATLEALAEQDIQFTILAQRQAARVRKTQVNAPWRDVHDGRIDPTRPYLCRLPSGRKIVLFFYDGPISQAVAFEGVLENGDQFAGRLLSGLAHHRKWDQLMHIATDGETYGHHHKFGEMALAVALRKIANEHHAILTNYGQFLEQHPPTHEVEIIEKASWSCAHGVERWQAHCGCNSGGHSGWNQTWRGPLRHALDNLRDRLAVLFDERAREYFNHPWEARNDAIDLQLRPTDDERWRFMERHATRPLTPEENASAMKMLEIQRNALLMYTSCGWFFDEISGIESVQVLKYAGRAAELAQEVFGVDVETEFVNWLARARSNIGEHKNGAEIYRKWVRPGGAAVIDRRKRPRHRVAA